MTDTEKGQEYLYNLILKRGKIPNDYPIDAWTEIGPLFSNFELSKDFRKEISIFYGVSFQCLKVMDSYTETGFSWSTTMDPSMQRIMSQHKMDIIFNELKLIRTKIENSLKRSKIIGKVYNYRTNRVEYELEDGNFIQIEGDKLIPPVMELDDTVFPDCFLYGRGRIASLRENRINDILDNDTM